MARSKEFDQAAVLRKAMEVFGHYGYEGTSLPNLLEGLGIARQSLYDTFGTKQELFISAVKRYVSEKTSMVIDLLEAPGSVKEAVARIFREGAAVLKDEVRSKECFILQSAIEQIPHTPEIARFLREDMERLEKAFEAALARAVEQGELKKPRHSLNALARYLNHARYSLTQAALLHKDPAALDQIVEVTLSVLEE